jgi:hypothetical protein
MRKVIGLAVGSIWLVTLLAIPRVANADVSYGCFVCKYTAPVGLGAHCHQVGPGENGDGWKCTEITDLPWPNGPECYVDGGACYNSAAGGGGGPSGGGGGGTTCQVSGFCPAECFSCGSGGGGKPAV